MKAALLGLTLLVLGVVSARAEIVITGFGSVQTNPVNASGDLTGSWSGAGTVTVDALDLTNVSNLAGVSNGLYADLTADGRAPVAIGANPAGVTLTGTLLSAPPGIDKFSVTLYDTSGSYNALVYTFSWSAFAAGGANGATVVGTLSGGSGVFNGTVGSWGLNLFDATGVDPTILSVSFSDLGVVTASPQITSPKTVEATAGQPFSYQITASNAPTAYAAGGLPDGLTVDAASGAITGTPSTSGMFEVTLSAANASGASSVTLTLNVFAATASYYPTITSAAAASAYVGQPFRYQITATNNPLSFGATGLPDGLSVDAAGGIIAGTPTQAGVFNVNLSAANTSGTGSATLSLTVGGGTAPVAAPVINSAASAAAQVGVVFSYQITATNAPASFAASGLPDGLTLDAASGIISGAPTAAGTFTVTLAATNAGGTGMATLTLGVAPAAVVVSPVPAVVTVAVAGDGEAVEGGESGKVVFRRTGDLSAALAVRYKVKGVGVAGVDYKPLSGVVTIPAGAAQAKIKIKPINNATVDGTRVAKVKLVPSADGSYTLSTVTVAKIRIVDND